MFILGCWN